MPLAIDSLAAEAQLVGGPLAIDSLAAEAHSFFVSTELDSSNRVAAVAVRNWRTRRICSCLSARRGAELPRS